MRDRSLWRLLLRRKTCDVKFFSTLIVDSLEVLAWPMDFSTQTIGIFDLLS